MAGFNRFVVVAVTKIPYNGIVWGINKVGIEIRSRNE